MPPATAGIVALLVAYYTMEQAGSQQSQTGWAGYIPEWLSKGVFVAFITGGTAFIAYLTARKYPTLSNTATIVGIATVLVATYATRWCNPMGGVIAGLTATGITTVLATVVNSQAGKVRRNIVIDNGGLPAQSNAKPEEEYIRIVPFAQIALATFMVIVVLIAFTNEDLAGSRTQLLTFAGIGIMAASVISAERSLRNVLAMVGVAISVAGAYLELDQALAMDNGEVGASVILIAAGIVTGALIVRLAFQGDTVVRLLVAPTLAAAAVAGVTLLMTMIPIVFISVGCKLPATGIVVLTLMAGTLAISASVITFVGVTVMALRNWMKAKATTTSGDSE